MYETYELTRQIIRRRTFRTIATERFHKSGGAPLFSGDARIGYLASETTFVDAENRPVVRFGPNRALAPSSHCLRRGNRELVAEIRHSLVQSAWGGKGFAVTDAGGASLFNLVPGETLKTASGPLMESLFRNALYVVRGGDVLGHTGSESDSTQSGGAEATAARRIGRVAAELPGALANIFKEEFLGRRVEREAPVVACFTLLESGALEPQIIFAILMFKVHYHNMRGF